MKGKINKRILFMAAFGALIMCTISLAPISLAQEGEMGETGLLIVGAGLAAGLACFGAGIGLGIAGSAAIGAISEKPEMFGMTFIYIVFVEAVAIYGLVIAFMVLGMV
ncbi:MAG: ATP synthase subunit C [Candidatus Methylarchaceae archaeon HK02M2]|nr:ATP synthase subunit C [Candidatus Methylarchaceae archaeon HK02M2]